MTQFVEGDGSIVQQRRVRVSALFVACAPLTLLLFNTDWLLTSESWLDAWHYVGFFHEYTNPDYSPGAYKLARLPWILSGYLAHQVLPTVVAAYVLHLGFLVVTCLALFVGVYALLGQPVLAATTAILLGFYTHAHGSGGWDYHNTAAGAFYLLAFMALAVESTAATSSALRLIAAGASAALAIHSNITMVNFLPALALVFVAACWERHRQVTVRRLVRDLVTFTAGGLLITIALGVVNWAVGREPLFFDELVRIVTRYVGDSGYVAGWRRMTPQGWMFRYPYLGLLWATFVVGTYRLITSRQPHPHAVVWRAMVLQFQLMLLVWVGWQVAGQLALDWIYFAYVLIPSCFVAIGGLLHPTWAPDLERRPVLTLTIAIVACAGALSGVFEPAIGHIAAFIDEWAAVAIGLIFAGAFLVVRPTGRALAGALLFGLFALGNLMATANPTEYAYSDQCKVQGPVYSGIVASATWLGEVDPSFSLTRSWFPEHDELHPLPGCRVRLAQLGGAITQMAGFQYITRPWPMPGVNDLPIETVEAIAGGDMLLALITADRDTHLDGWKVKLRNASIGYRPVARRGFRFVNSTLNIDVWRLFTLPPTAVDFDTPLLRIGATDAMAVNVYGSPKGEVVVRDGRRVFEPTDRRDHLASQFVDLTTREANAWLRLAIASDVVQSRWSCRVTVQSDDFAILGALPCSSRQEETQLGYMRVPARAKAIRVMLYDPRRHPILVPKSIEVTLGAPRTGADASR